MNKSTKGIGAGYGRLKSENVSLKKTIEGLKFEIAMLKNQNRQLFQQVYDNEINLNGRGTMTVGRNSGLL